MSEKAITFRLENSLVEAIKDVARANERTMSGEVRYALREHVRTFTPPAEPCPAETPKGE